MTHTLNKSIETAIKAALRHEGVLDTVILDSIDVRVKDVPVNNAGTEHRREVYIGFTGFNLIHIEGETSDATD